MTSTISLSTLCGRVHPVGFTTDVSVTGFLPSTKLGIDLLDLDQKRLQLLSSGTMTTDPSVALTAATVRINVPDGLYFVRVFVDDGAGNPAQGQPESQVQVAAPCDVLYVPAIISTTPTLLVEIVDVTVRSAPEHIRYLVLVPLSKLVFLELSPDRRRFYAIGPLPDPGPPGAPNTYSLGVYDAATQTQINAVEISGNTKAGALSTDGQTLYLAAGATIILIATATLAIRPQGFTEPAGNPIDALVFSPDGNTLADQLVMTPDGGQLYVAKHPTDTRTPQDTLTPQTLDLFDTRTNSLTGRSIYEFKQLSTVRVPMIIRSSARS